MEGRINWRCDRLLVHIILGRMSARCQRALHTKEFDRLANPRLVAEIEGNMKRGQEEILLHRRICVAHRSAEAEARAAERHLTIVSVRVTPAVRGDDDCSFSDNEGDEPMDVAVAVDVVEKCTCHIVKLCRNALGQGTAYCSCPSPSALLCKHIYGVCCWLTGGNTKLGGLATFGLCMTDLRQDRDPDDFDDADIDGELQLGRVAPVTAASDDDEPGPVAAAPMADPVALAAILTVIDTTFAGLSLKTKMNEDALCDAVIYALRERMHSRDTAVKRPQRPGQSGQSSAARPTAGPMAAATSAAVVGFWAAVPVGRPKTTGMASHRTPMTSVPLLMAALTRPAAGAVAAVTRRAPPMAVVSSSAYSATPARSSTALPSRTLPQPPPVVVSLPKASSASATPTVTSASLMATTTAPAVSPARGHHRPVPDSPVIDAKRRQQLQPPSK